jgi:phosphatidylserine/phosphatidylglycerophosphate/cardiolipin synthase-like enzyme
VWDSGRAAVLVDAEAYFDAAVQAMEAARRSIHFLNWAFEPETRLKPRPAGAAGPDETIAELLKRLAAARPELDVRILCWQSALPVAATQKFFPIVDRRTFAGSRVRFILDGELPLGAAHHQKAIIIDDSLAFCGGADIGQDRWDTPRHLDEDPRRKAGKTYYPSRHEVMALVDGPPAAALGELFRHRWRRCTGEALEAGSPGAPQTSPPAAWPAAVEAVFESVRVGLSRTEGAWRRHPEVRECEALHLAAIAGAKRLIYMENQYFTSQLMASALARRLSEPRGPEVVLVSTGHSPSYFDELTMDPTRSRFIEALRAADRFGRFQIYSPVTTLGQVIIVHAKVTIIDDDLVRIGSANLNNRSFGFDTECDLSLEAAGATADRSRAAIGGLRTGLLAHWLGCGEAVFEAALASAPGVGGAIESLRLAGYCRLRPIAPKRLHPISALIARLHLGDPMSPRDSFRPWTRRAALARALAAAGLDPQR